MKYSIVVPVFNEAANLQELHDSIGKVMLDISTDYEILFVDDASTDGTSGILREIYEHDPHVIVIRFRRNAGQSSALTAGFRQGSGDVVVSMDGDLQAGAYEIPKLLQKLNDGYDVVCGWRKNRRDALLTKRLPSLLSNWWARKISGLPLHDFGSTMRVYRREALRGLSLYGELHRYVPVLIAWKGYKITEVEIAHSARKYGTSKYGAGRLFRGSVDLITVYLLSRYLSRPMHLFGLFGFLVFSAGTITGLYLVFLKLFYGVAIGERPLLLLSILMVLLGVQSAMIGFIGEMFTRYQSQDEKNVFYEIQEVMAHQSIGESPKKG